MIDGSWFAFPEKLLGNSPGTYHIIPYSLGKLSCFTDLNLKAIKGMISHIKTMISRVRENSEVVMKFTQI